MNQVDAFRTKMQIRLDNAHKRIEILSADFKDEIDYLEVKLVDIETKIENMDSFENGDLRAVIDDVGEMWQEVEAAIKKYSDLV